MITRRDALAALAALGAVTVGRVAPAFAHHGGESVGADDMVLGEAGAPVTILEYSSLTCPHCANFHNDTLPRIKERYIDSGKARLVYRDFPFDRVGVLAAAVAHCAGRDKYFGFLEVLFRTQKSWARAEDPVEALARVSRLGGLKRDAIDVCIADQELLDRILASRLNGAKEFGINSTPTFIINGEKLVGAQPFERFEEILEGLLSQS
ncbi:MAG: DsbA family protein [Alphaproteobacteria bacterium]